MRSNGSQNSRKLRFASLLKDVIKDANQQPDEEICRVGSCTKELLSAWSLRPGSVVSGNVPVPQAWMLSRKKGPESCPLEFLARIHYTVMTD